MLSLKTILTGMIQSIRSSHVHSDNTFSTFVTIAARTDIANKY